MRTILAAKITEATRGTSFLLNSFPCRAGVVKLSVLVIKRLLSGSNVSGFHPDAEQGRAFFGMALSVKVGFQALEKAGNGTFSLISG